MKNAVGCPSCDAAATAWTPAGPSGMATAPSGVVGATSKTGSVGGICVDVKDFECGAEEDGKEDDGADVSAGVLKFVNSVRKTIMQSITRTTSMATMTTTTK